jgi:hypothetical protein
MPCLKLALATSLLTLIAAPALAKPQAAGAKQAIQAAYRQMDRAVDRKDLKTLYRFYDPTYVGYTLQGGQKDLETSRAEAEAFIPHVLRSSSSTVVLSASPQGSGVVVTDRTRSTLLVVNPNTHQHMVLKQDETDRDYWVRETGGWKIRQERTLALSASLNGRSIPESAFEGSI